MYMYIFVCVCVCMYVCMHACIFVDTVACTQHHGVLLSHLFYTLSHYEPHKLNPYATCLVLTAVKIQANLHLYTIS
jgi:hypothetical protein